jgi:hypothetical protein
MGYIGSKVFDGIENYHVIQTPLDYDGIMAGM